MNQTAGCGVGMKLLAKIEKSYQVPSLSILTSVALYLRAGITALRSFVAVLFLSQQEHSGRKYFTYQLECLFLVGLFIYSLEVVSCSHGTLLTKMCQCLWIFQGRLGYQPWLTTIQLTMLTLVTKIMQCKPVVSAFCPQLVDGTR